MNKVVIHRCENTPKMVVVDDEKYRVKECNGVTYTLPSVAYEIAMDLLEYSHTFSDDEIIEINQKLLDAEFRGNR